MPDFIVNPAADNATATLDLRSLIDVEKLQHIQNDFAISTRLAVTTVDSMGRPVTEASRFSALCQYLRHDPVIRAKCHSYDAHSGLQSATERHSIVYRYHTGLVDFSVSITWDAQHLDAMMAGQVLLTEGQQRPQQIVGASEVLEHSETTKLLGQVAVVDLGKLQAIANEIVGLANAKLDSALGEADFAVAMVGTVLSRLNRIPNPSGNAALAPLLTGIRKSLLLIPVESVKWRTSLEAPVMARNVAQGNTTMSLELLGDYLDHLLPRWSQKADPKELSEYEDMMTGIAISETVQFERDISQIVTRHRGRRRGPMNRYECQVYCEKLLIRVHDLLEPASQGGERNLMTLLNEIERNPSPFLTLHKAASYLMWSESHFAGKFKERTGSSFIHYATAKRLERVKFMLIHTDKPMLRIVTELDFTPLNYFSQQSKKHIRVTPSEYRREHPEGAA